MKKIFLLLFLVGAFPCLARAQSFGGQSSSTIRVVPPYSMCVGSDNGKDVCFQNTSANVAKVLNGGLDFALVNYTVATLPPAALNDGRIYRVTNGNSTSDCTSGGGTNKVVCISNGAAWTSLGSGGGGGSPGGAATNVQFNNGSFGGDSNFTWDNTAKNVAIGQFGASAHGGSLNIYSPPMGTSDQTGRTMLVLNCVSISIGNGCNGGGPSATPSYAFLGMDGDNIFVIGGNGLGRIAFLTTPTVESFAPWTFNDNNTFGGNTVTINPSVVKTSGDALCVSNDGSGGTCGTPWLEIKNTNGNLLTQQINATGSINASTNLSAGTTPSGISGSALGGIGFTQATSTGWTPTAGTSYIRADSASNKLKCSENGGAEVNCIGAAGGVTSFTGDGALITNSGSTGAVTLTLGNAGAHKWWGNNTGVSGAPGYFSIGTADLPVAIPIGNIGSAGLSGTSPISIASTGAISCATCVTSAALVTNNILTKGAGGQAIQLSSVTDDGTTFSTAEPITTTSTVSSGSSPPTCTAGTGGVLCQGEGTGPTGAATVDMIWADSANHCHHFSWNNSDKGCAGALAAAQTWTAAQSFNTGDLIPNTVQMPEISAPSGVAAADVLWADSTAHEVKANLVNGGAALVNITRPSPINQTAKTAAITTATLCASSAGNCNVAGQYRVEWNFWGSGTACSSVTAGSVTFLLTWTDENATVHSAVAQQMLAQTGAATMAIGGTFPFQTALANESATGSAIISTNGSVIQYATGYTACTTGTGTYNLRASVTRVQ